ncbi:MAG: hypothetical protein AB7U24_05625 [Sulfurimonadaceae bacterium]
MKVLVCFLACLYALHAMNLSGDIRVGHGDYDSYPTESVATGELKVQLKNETTQVHAIAEFLYSDRYEQRRYALLRELELRRDIGSYSLSLGKTIRFLGALEGYNVTDIYNRKNYLLDPFSKSAKLGTWGAHAIVYLDEASVSVSVKLYEEDQKYPTYPTPYRFFSWHYDESLNAEQSRYSPSVLGVYTFAPTDFLEIQAGVFQGYDSKRTFSFSNATTIAQNAYRATKALLVLNAVFQESILKLEAVYTDVAKGKNLSDYVQIGVGAEHGMYNIFGTDLGVYGEYYYYGYLGESMKNVDLSEIYDNDIFLALKWNLNDVGSTQIKGGVLHDIKRGERVVRIESSSRFFEMFTVDAAFLQTLAKKDTPLHFTGDMQRVTFGLTYNF